MKKVYLFLLGICLSMSYAVAVEGGNLSCSPDPIPDLDSDITFIYNAEDAFEGEDYLFVHFWLNPKEGEAFAGNYTTNWDNLDVDRQEMSDLAGDRIFSLTINIANYFGVTDADKEKVLSVGFLVRNATGSMQTNGEIVGVGAAIGSEDRFKISYGIAGSAWSDVHFTQSSTDENKFTATLTLPDDYEEAGYQYWVGYNGGGTGEPAWVDGQSSTVNIASIPGIKAGENTLEIDRTSAEPNWGITANGGSLVYSDRFNIQYGVEGSPWTDLEFTQSSTNENEYTITITLPDDFSAYKFWVGYNNGGSGAPSWNQDQSETVDISTIPGIKAGENLLTINKTSTEKNWGVTAGDPTGISFNEATGTNCYVDGNLIKVDSEQAVPVEVYNVAGNLIDRAVVNGTYSKSVSTGVYIVRVNNKTQKVVVK